MTTTRMAFADYLAQPEIQEQIHNNIREHSRQDIKTSDPSQILPRIFNNLPLEYNELNPFFALLPEAARNDEIDLWINLITYQGMLDLFNADGDIHEVIYHLLNAKQADKKIGMLDFIQTRVSPEDLKKGLLASYLFSTAEKAINTLQGKLTDTDPAYLCSHAYNMRLTNIKHVDKNYVLAFKSILVAATRDETIKSKEMRAFIKRFIEKPVSLFRGIAGWVKAGWPHPPNEMGIKRLNQS